MPGRPERGTAGVLFHVLNRGVRRATLFGGDSDYLAFLTVLAEAKRRIPLRLLAFCVMPNHFHLVAWPQADRQLSGFMHWLTMTHSKRWHRHRGTTGTGSVYQGRYKAFPIQTDEHLLTVCRYVEQNPLRAGLVARAENWRWSSFSGGGRNCHGIELSEWPILRPASYARWVNTTFAQPSLAAVRRSVHRDTPYGDLTWSTQTATALDLTRSIRPRGRPRKKTSGVFFHEA
jgi:REP-associated tyrosine transposase